METSSIGYGCASLYAIPTRKERQIVLDAAFDAGIRHFDVAPMYGLGLAESELSTLVSRHRDEITVATKFGIDVNAAGKIFGRVQGPMRRLMTRMPQIREKVRGPGGSNAGLANSLLYVTSPNTVANAKRSLDASLRRLKVDYIDVFLLHDPQSDLLPDHEGLTAYLDAQVESGTIRTWGIASDAHAPNGEVEQMIWHSPVLQAREDIFTKTEEVTRKHPGARISFGIIERGLTGFTEYFEQFPAEREAWSSRLDCDLAAASGIANVLLSQALCSNDRGPVLFSSTKVHRIFQAAAQAGSEQMSHSQSAKLGELAGAVQAWWGGDASHEN
ncbi:MAG TPA: aldo/keto reductase [Acidimicrobiales bacterium]|nr:aldo/keto reductase [Acidimicrobiales bacterium]